MRLFVNTIGLQTLSNWTVSHISLHCLDNGDDALVSSSSISRKKCWTGKCIDDLTLLNGLGEVDDILFETISSVVLISFCEK